MSGRTDVPRPLEGTSALVTGATRGIGLAVARKIAAAGARVFVLARTVEALEDVAAETGASVLVADVSDEASVVRAAGELREALGEPPDLLVNAAGVFSLDPFVDTDLVEMERSLEVNLTGAFRVLRQFLPGMLERGSGTIVNVGSVAGRRPLPGNAAYAASKYGLRGMHEVLVEELGGTGVRATLLEPAATNTPLWDAFEPDLGAELPARSDMLSPERVADAVLFVATRPRDTQIPLLQIQRA